MKILVPVDLSDRSRSGISYAAMLASRFGSSLVLVTNVNMPEQSVLEKYADENNVSLDELGTTPLIAMADELAPGLDREAVFSFSAFPADGILTVATEHHVDMIVMTSHGRSGMTRWLLGSVTEKVARGADIPVVIVPTRDS